MQSTLLIIHIMAAAVWIGASATSVLATPRLRKHGHESGSGFISVYESMGRAY